MPMPNPALDAYLAKHYLDGPKAEAYLARSGETDAGKRKKRKGEGLHSGGGVRVVDDADQTWKKANTSDDDESTAAAIVDVEEQRRSRWNKVGESRPIRAGLKTREEMRAERLERERREAETSDGGGSGGGGSSGNLTHKREREQRQEEETVYRDASGRKIDVEKEEAEEQRRRKDEKRREREKREWTKGEKQREDERRAREREREERHTSFARSASDARMNETLRNVVRADDPAARFLTNTSSTATPRKPTYNGPAPPNRFGIRPGYRWDGVERSNGFESKLFQRRNERARSKAEKQAWSQEDM